MTGSHHSTAEDQESERTKKKRGMLRRMKIERTRPSLMRVLSSVRSSSRGRLAGEDGGGAAAAVGTLAESEGCLRSSCSREDRRTAAGSFGRPAAAAGGGSAAPGGC